MEAAYLGGAVLNPTMNKISSRGVLFEKKKEKKTELHAVAKTF